MSARAAGLKADDPAVALALRAAERLEGRLGPGERIVYATGSLARLCGEYGSPRDDAERSWRQVRRAAQRAEAEGRVALVQRRLPDGGMEYIAVGLGARR